MKLSKREMITNKKVKYRYNQKLISVNYLKKEKTNRDYNFIISVYKNKYQKLILNFLDEANYHYKTEKSDNNYHLIYVYISSRKEKLLFLNKIRTLINKHLS